MHDFTTKKQSGVCIEKATMVMSLPIPMLVTLQKETIRGLYGKGYNSHEFAYTHAQNFTTRNNQGSVWKRLQQS